jgi:two-component system, NarL family, nitrate/nitrite response regulator NarL
MRIVVIDDHPLFREGVTRALALEGDLSTVGEGETCADAVRLASKLHPDVLLLDLDIPGGGLSVLEAIRAASPTTRIVVLTASARQEYLLAALKSGATSYVLKGVSARELARILRAACADQAYVPPELAAGVLATMSGRKPPERSASALDQLTEREREILAMVGDGRTNGEIAKALCLAETTVKNAMTTIMQKLNVRNRVEAAVLAHRVGPVPRDHPHPVGRANP